MSPTPYDGSPSGNELGFAMDASQRQMYQDAHDASLHGSEISKTPANLVLFLLGLCVALFVITY